MLVSLHTSLNKEQNPYDVEPFNGMLFAWMRYARRVTALSFPLGKCCSSRRGIRDKRRSSSVLFTHCTKSIYHVPTPASDQDVDKLKGMKWLLAMVSKGRDVSEFFSDVVKNMAVRSVEVKKMVYIYLVHYADNDAQCRELALLSINSFQNDLRGSNQVRGCISVYVLL